MKVLFAISAELITLLLILCTVILLLLHERCQLLN